MEILSEHRDCYCQQLDNSEVGIRATISRLSEALRQRDAELHAHLAALKVEPQFYAFRWITLMLTQEFPLPDVVQLWVSKAVEERGGLGAAGCHHLTLWGEMGAASPASRPAP